MEEAILNNNNKAVTLVLISAIAMSCICLQLKPINAQSVPTPAVPEFTLKYTHIISSNNTITVTINNQQFSSKINGTTYQLSYDIRIRVHSAKESRWTDLYYSGTYYDREFTSYLQERFAYIRNGTPIQSNSEYTVVPLTYYIDNQYISRPLAFNSTFEIQVMGAISHSTQGWVAYQAQSPVLGGQFVPVMSVDTVSNWSKTQTITIPEESATPNSSPTVPEFPIVAIIPLMIALISAAIILKIKKPSSKLVFSKLHSMAKFISKLKLRRN
jgi:hypothetical protein